MTERCRSDLDISQCSSFIAHNALRRPMMQKLGKIVNNELSEHDHHKLM